MRFRLSTRLILGVVLIEAVMLGALVWNSVRLIGSSHAELLERSTREESILLANSLAPGLAASDRAVLLDVLSLLKDKQNLRYAVVHNRAGEIMAALGQPPLRADWRQDRRYADARQDDIFDVEEPIDLAGQRLGVLRAGYSLHEVEKFTQQTRLQNTGIALLTIVLTVAATVLLGLLLTRNLRRLEFGAGALQRGELHHRIDIDGRDEIGDVARAFNALGEHLEQAQSELASEHAALQRESRRLNTLLNGINAVVWEADPATRCFTYVSKEAEKLLGYPAQDWLAPDFLARHMHPEDRKWVLDEASHQASVPGTASADFRVFDHGGRCLWVRDIRTVELDQQGRPALRGLMLDVTDEKAAAERIIHLAEHDVLTGLMNRRRFQEDLERHIAYAQRYAHQGALLFVDLDQFKYINDSFGHQYGDEYLAQVARRLSAALRSTDTLGRLGGDEFGIILPRVESGEAEQVAQMLLATLARAELIQGSRYSHVSASIGIALFPVHGASPSELLARADTAMYAAKDRGRNRCHLYSEEDAGVARMHAKIHWEDQIRRALAEDRFVVHYQPVYEIDSGRIRHYEVLLRMLADDGGLIPPGAFLDTAERFGLIRDIDCWVLDKTLAVQAESRRRGAPVQLAVNLSGRHFGSTEILDLVQESLAKHGADPHSIIFEVTETAAVENIARARSFIESLRALGCRFALDDFGAGFSSFHYVKNLPIDFIKIDGSFVRNVHNDKADRIFVRAITDLAHGLGIATVAEFVESEAVLATLRSLGVQLGQGYFLARPSATFVDDQPVRVGQTS